MMRSPSAHRPRLAPLGAEAKPWLLPGPHTIVLVVAALSWVWPVVEYRTIGGARGLVGAALVFGIEVICLAFALLLVANHEEKLG